MVFSSQKANTAFCDLVRMTNTDRRLQLQYKALHSHDHPSEKQKSIGKRLSKKERATLGAATRDRVPDDLITHCSNVNVSDFY